MKKERLKLIQSNKRLKEMVDSFETSQLKVQKNMRKVITGDENKRIRDEVKHRIRQTEDTIMQKLDEVPVKKGIDKYAFTFAVINICATELIMCKFPQHFDKWYFLIMGPFLSHRVYWYRIYKWQYFLLDFCYFVNAMCFVYTLFAPSSCLVFKTLFIIATGPLLVAAWIWRNSIVLHSLDKMCSVYLHTFPTMLMLCLRWFPASHQIDWIDSCGPAMNAMDLVLALLFYGVWQVRT